MQIRVPEGVAMINLNLIRKVIPYGYKNAISFLSEDGDVTMWSFKSKERFNEVLEQIQSFYKEL